MLTRRLLAFFLLFSLLESSPGVHSGEAGPGQALTPVTHSVHWETIANWPEFNHSVIDNKIQAWVAGQFAAFTPSDILTQLLPASGEDFDLGLAEEEASLQIDYQITQPSDQAISVILEVSTYVPRAAHGASSIHTLNFSLPSGEELGLDQLFREPGKALAIFAELSPGLILEDLRNNYPEVFENLPEPDDIWLSRDGFAPRRENYAAISLEPEGVRLFFGEYQVLPYAFGKSTALIPLSALAPAGPSSAVWPGVTLP